MSLFDPPRNDNGGTKIGIVIPRRKSSPHGSGLPGTVRRQPDGGETLKLARREGAPGLPVRGLGSLLRTPAGRVFKVVGQFR